MKQEYAVKLELFEGPLDLLLYLVTKAEINIVDISVSQIAEQYLQYLDLMRELNIDIASEYLHMAATLVRLKARELLPQGLSEPVTEEEGIYNREQLIQQLLEYKKFKEAAQSLRTFEAQQIGAFGRGTAESVPVADTADNEVYIGNISIFDLLTAFKRILDRAKEQDAEQRYAVQADMIRIDDRLEQVLTVLIDKGEVAFEELFADDTRRLVMVVTFMAILELIKMQEIRFRQERQFERIFVSRRDPATRDNLDDPDQRAAQPGADAPAAAQPDESTHDQPTQG